MQVRVKLDDFLSDAVSLTDYVMFHSIIFPADTWTE